MASSEVISQVLFTSEQTTPNKMAFVGILSQIKLLLGPLVIQIVRYILKQLFTSVSVKVVDIYLHFGEQLLIMGEKKNANSKAMKITEPCNHYSMKNDWLNKTH